MAKWYADTYLLYRVVSASPEARQAMGDALLVCTIVFWALAVLVSLLSAYLKIKVLISLRNRRKVEFSLIPIEDAYTLKHQQRKNDVTKSLHLAYANLIAGLLEDMPLGFIGLRFIQLSANQPELFGPISFLLLLSVFSSGFSMCMCMHMCSCRRGQEGNACANTNPMLCVQ